MEKEILDNIRTILKSSAKNFPTCVGKEINIRTRLDKDLDFDDLDIFYLSYELERKYNVNIPERKSKKFKTINDWVEYIQCTR